MAGHRATATYDHAAGTVRIDVAAPPLLAVVPNPVRPCGTSLDVMEVHELAKRLVRAALATTGVRFDERETPLFVDHVLAGAPRRSCGTRSNLVLAEAP